MTVSKKALFLLILSSLAFSVSAKDKKKKSSGKHAVSLTLEGNTHGVTAPTDEGADKDERKVGSGSFVLGYDYLTRPKVLLKKGKWGIFGTIGGGAKLYIPILKGSYRDEREENCEECNGVNLNFGGIDLGLRSVYKASDDVRFILDNQLKLGEFNLNGIGSDQDGVGRSSGAVDSLLFGNDGSSSQGITEESLKYYMANPQQLVSSTYFKDELRLKGQVDLGDFTFEGFISGGIELTNFNMIAPDTNFLIGSYGGGFMIINNDHKSLFQGIDFKFVQKENISDTDQLKIASNKIDFGLDLGKFRAGMNFGDTSLTLPSVSDAGRSNQISAKSLGFDLGFKF